MAGDGPTQAPPFPSRPAGSWVTSVAAPRLCLHGGLAFVLAWAALAAPARAAAPAPPTNCVAAGTGYSAGGASIRINWTDESLGETHWKIFYSTDNWVSYVYIGAVATATMNTTGTTVSVPWSGGLKNTEYRFKIAAYNNNNATQSEASSSSTPITTSVFALTASKVQCQTAISLTWPNVPNASRYRIFGAALGAATYTSLGYVNAGGTTCNVVSSAAFLLVPSLTYYFVVVPYMGDFDVGESNETSATVDIPATMTSKPGASGTPGSAFAHTFTHASAATVSSRTLSGDTHGLTFNSSTGTLTGVFPALGNYTLTYAVHFTSGSVLSQTFSIRVRAADGAPLVGTAIPAWTGTPGTTRDTALAGAFTDPEAESAVRVSTTLGTMDFILFDTATPATVANFMSYMNAGRYTDVVFHRSMPGFVIQGGAFKGTGTGNQFTGVVTHAPVMNEPGIPNMRGTLSMAKSNNPDSATCQFFVSVSNNNEDPYPLGLDYQNGGFTVFGRVAGNGMAVADAINNLPVGNYTSPPADLTVDGSSAGDIFANCPMNALSAPAAMEQDKLVKINSVTTIPTLSCSITGNSNPTVAQATIVDGQLHLTGLQGGLTTVTVSATDLDNHSTSQSVTVSLSDTYSTWAARNTFADGQNAATQDPDADGWNNLLEYAFLGDPSLANNTSQAVAAGTTGVAPGPQYLTLTFPVRKASAGLAYVVEGNDGLSGTWSEIWNSAYGYDYWTVVSAQDLTDRKLVTIHDTVALGVQAKRFMRIRILEP